MAAAVRPVAEVIQGSQERSDLQHYNDRFSSLKQVADAMENLQPRGDLPPLPAGLVRGHPDSVLEDRSVQPTAILPDAAPKPVEQVQELQNQLEEESRKANFGFYQKDDLPPSGDPVLDRLRAWRPDKGSGLL